MKKVNVAMVLSTNGLEYDDRIRKQILSIQHYNPNVTFKIFAIVSDNRSEIGITDYGVPYELISLKTRDRYTSSSHLIQKAYEFYSHIHKKIKNFDIIWCADCHVFMFPLLLPYKTKIVWDLHELPDPFMKNKIMKVIFRFLESKCKLFYHANDERIQYLKNLNMIHQINKHIAIRNYPDKTILDEEMDEKNNQFKDFINWLGNTECVYIQGINNKARRSYESLSSICMIDNLKAVVIGNVDKEAILKLENEFGSEKINNTFFFTGMVPQRFTKQYINACKLSLIFYEESSPNNKYCEPNRLYQAVYSGLPVVVGCNPPMKDFIDKFEVGISLESDGDNINEIVEAIKKIQSQYSFYKQQIEKNKEHFIWESQEELIMESFSKLLL